MPAQQRIRLDNHEYLLPCWQLACQQHKQRPVAPGQGWSFHLPFQHDELLAQERVFQYQFRLTARQVQGCIQD